MDKELNRNFWIERRHINVQQIYEKIPNITNHQRTANQNHNEISPWDFSGGPVVKTQCFQHRGHWFDLW